MSTELTAAIALTDCTLVYVEFSFAAIKLWRAGHQVPGVRLYAVLTGIVALIFALFGAGLAVALAA